MSTHEFEDIVSNFPSFEGIMSPFENKNTGYLDITSVATILSAVCLQVTPVKV